jgi:hypothetical protein
LSRDPKNEAAAPTIRGILLKELWLVLASLRYWQITERRLAMHLNIEGEMLLAELHLVLLALN